MQLMEQVQKPRNPRKKGKRKRAPCKKCGGDHLTKDCYLRKGGKVEVLYDGEWWSAEILFRHSHRNGGGYKIHYFDGEGENGEGSTQPNVPSENIRPVTKKE